MNPEVIAAIPAMQQAASANRAKFLNWAIIAIIVVAVCVIVWQIFKATQEGSKAIGTIIGDATVATQTGVDINRVAYLRSLGQELWFKGVERSWKTLWVRDYNEEKFIAAINQCKDTKEASLLNQAYKTVSAESLGDAVRASFKESDIAKCNNIIISTILTW